MQISYRNFIYIQKLIVTPCSLLRKCKNANYESVISI